MAIPDVDLDAAFLDPGQHFDDPEAVAHHPDLSREQKLRLLRQWGRDARELADPGGVDDDPRDPEMSPDLLTQVERALAEVTGGTPPPE